MIAVSDALLEFQLSTHDGGACNAITLQHPLLGAEPRRLVRGKTTSLLAGTAPLPWTSAVRAFVVLALRHALSDVANTRAEQDPFANGLRGGRGSYARSLDYAIAKKPAWILDLFGVNPDNKPYVGRFFWRDNPEGKRPGDVSVTLNTKLFPAQHIRFFVDDTQTHCAQALRQLLAMFEGGSPRTPLPPSAASPADTADSRPPLKPPSSFQELLVALAKRELTHTLSETPVFSGTQLKQSLSEITTHRLVQSLAGKEHSTLGSILDWSTPAIRSGLNPSLDPIMRRYSDERPLTVSLCVVTIGSIVLFEYLKRYRKIPLELNYRFSTGGEVARAILERSIEPDLCVGATPSAALMVARVRKKTYQPVMLLPKHTHAMLAPQHGVHKGGDYRFLLEEPSGAQFYFEELKNRGHVRPSKVAVKHCDVDETLYSLAHGSSDLRCILWFPMYDLAAAYCGARLVDQKVRHLGENWIFLMAHQNLVQNPRLLHTLLAELHGAWLDLREREELLESVIRSIVEEPNYIKTLMRAHGFHRLGSSASNNEANAYPTHQEGEILAPR